jgi:hypothetical protein
MAWFTLGPFWLDTYFEFRLSCIETRRRAILMKYVVILLSSSRIAGIVHKFGHGRFLLHYFQCLVPWSSHHSTTCSPSYNSREWWGAPWLAMRFLSYSRNSQLSVQRWGLLPWSQDSLSWVRWMLSSPSQLIFWRHILILPSRLHLGFPLSVLRSGFLTKTLYAFVVSHGRNY